jgi:hypothetical protein
MTYIRGDLFAELADFCYTDSKNDGDCEKFPNTFSQEAVEKFNGIPLIYTCTCNVDAILNLLAPIKKKTLLVTHSTDWKITEERYNKLPPNVIRWFSPNVAFRGERLQSVPLGLETLQRFSFHHIHKIEKMQVKSQQEKIFKNWLFLCHSSHQANIADRENAYKVLANKSFVTTVYRPNIFAFDDYIDNIYSHPFMISPEGSGIDCHRTWECLYLDTIPILKRCVNTSYYEDLPICFVEDWTQVTEEFLKNEYTRISNSEWNLDKIDFEYWKRIIQNLKQQYA